MSQKKSVFEQNVGKILVALMISFILGTVTMVYKSDKNNALLSLQLHYLGETVSRLRLKIESVADSRWTKLDHESYSTLVNSRLKEIERRVEAIEKKLQ